MSAEVIAVIPARFGSTRFPGKPLARETGRPMIQHTWEQACAAKRIGRVIIATDDQRICTAAAEFGAEAVMTSPAHPNGTSRIAEVAESMPGDPLIVNVQGDEPEINPAHIDAAIEFFLERQEDAVAPAMGTLAAPFGPGEDPADPNIVKVVLDRSGGALYFSRSPIPFHRDPQQPRSVDMLRHLGLYVYRRRFLLEYIGLAPGVLEEAEKLEQLRALEHGRRIVVALADSAHNGVDTPEDYARFADRHRRR